MARGLGVQLLAVLCSLLLLCNNSFLWAQAQSQPEQESARIPNDQLDSLVAPIALYPDPLLAQLLAASTYPLEIIQLQQWLMKNKNLKDKALADAVEKHNWDPSVEAMAILPDVVKRLSDDIRWTTDLGNAFLAQQSDVMDAVQRMRQKAEGKGNLKSTEQQKVETKVIDNKTVIVIEQQNPQVVYVPSYDPVAVYGPPVYPYPPIYYPPAGYYAAGMAISFGVGMALGAAWGGGWGWGCGWGGNNNININNNNNFVRNSNRVNANNIGNRTGVGNSWQHNPQHRGGTPYSNRSTASKYGGTTRGDSLGNRQSAARQNQGQIGNRQSAGAGDRAVGGAGGNLGSNRGAGRSGGATLSAENFAGRNGGDRVGDRSVSRGSGASSRGDAFGGSGGMSGGSTRASSTRGASSMRGGGGGGAHRGGGGGRRR